MDANAGDRDMVFQRRLPAGEYAPHHALVPTYGQTTRRNTSRTDGHLKREGNAFLQTGLADAGARYSIPQLPLERANLTGVVGCGQLTLSYRLLPFSGRSLVGSMPQNRTNATLRRTIRPAPLPATG